MPIFFYLLHLMLQGATKQVKKQMVKKVYMPKIMGAGEY